MAPHREDTSNERGQRAEEVANWYFRLNGFLQIPGFVLHSDEARRQISDADIVGVRFPYSGESLRGIRMIDDRWVQQLSSPRKILFVIAEVKAKGCKLNGSWTNDMQGGMERVIDRIGFAPEAMTAEIAKSMYDTLNWENSDFCMQYVTIGSQKNHDLRRFPKLVQLTWEDIAAFLFERFHGFGAIKGVHNQWPPFGQHFAREFYHIAHAGDALTCVSEYINSGDPV